MVGGPLSWRRMAGAILGSLYLFVFGKLLTYHFRILTHPYALEYREGMATSFTQLMLKVQDPFALAHEPALLNNYGIGYHLFVWPLAKIWGPNFFVHRLVAALAVFFCLGLMALYLRRQNVSWPLVAAGILSWYAALLFPGTTSALSGPHAAGLCLWMTAILVPVLDQYRWRSLLLTAVLTVLAFYTKLYFVSGAFILAAYMFLFVDKKKALGLGLLTAGVLALSIWFVNQRLQTYFSMTFFVAANSQDYALSQLFEQLKTLTWFHLSIAATWLAAAVWALWKGPRHFQVSIHLFCLLVFTAIICCSMGGGRGQYMAFLFQLISPWLIIVALISINRFEWSRWLCTAWTAAAFLLPAYAPLHVFHWTEKDADNWRRADELVKSHNHILNYPAVASLLVDHGKEIYDNGAMEYAKYGIGREGIWKHFLKPDLPLFFRIMQFYDGVRQEVMEKKFDVVIINDWSKLLFPELQQQYVLREKLELNMPHWNLGNEVYVLVPRP